MQATHPWLPADCLTGPDVAAPFVRLVEEWSSAWFGAGKWAPGASWQAGETPEAEGWSMLREEPGFRILGRAACKQELALDVLGLDELETASVSDQRLVRGLANKVLDDLAQRLNDLVGGAATDRTGYAAVAAARSGTTYLLALGPLRTRMLAVEVDMVDLAAIGRRAFARSALPTDLSPRSESFRTQEFEISARLGETSLTFEEVAQLEVGDVLLLDRAANEPVQLQAAGRHIDLPVLLRERGGKICLELKENP